MRRVVVTSILYTVVTTALLGVGYPLAVYVFAKVAFPQQANGSLIEKNGTLVGSQLIGQTFTGDKYFHSRPSAAGAGYDPTASGGSNLRPTNKQLTHRVRADVFKLHQENPGASIPADMVTASGSGLDPNISPASAEFQMNRV